MPPWAACRNTRTGTPVMSSSVTASLTESCFSRVVDSAMMTGVKPAMIAAQPLLDPQRRLVGAGIGVWRHAFGVERDLGIEMDDAFGAEAETVPRQGQVPGI